MEPELVQSQNQDIRPPVVTEVAPTNNKLKKKIAYIATGVVVLAALVVGIRYFSKKENIVYPETPAETLDALKSSSLPVTETPDERGEELKELSKGSKPVTVTQEAQLEQLKNLRD